MCGLGSLLSVCKKSICPKLQKFEKMRKHHEQKHILRRGKVLKHPANRFGGLLYSLRVAWSLVRRTQVCRIRQLRFGRRADLGGDFRENGFRVHEQLQGACRLVCQAHGKHGAVEMPSRAVFL